jgi:glycosyltransferase involved in cell wall biosynthesis
MLQGEDQFLDSLPETDRQTAWDVLRERARDVDRFVAPSRYFADRMRERLELAPEHVEIVANGIQLEGFSDPAASSKTVRPGADAPPALGFFTRMCPEKGLDQLVAAYIRLRQRNRIPGLKLRVGGGCGPSDKSFVAQLRQQLSAVGYLEDVSFHPNVTRAEKIAFLRSLNVFSVPAVYGEAFGLYVLEAWAAGVPVVQPRAASFPELIEATGGGLLVEPQNPEALAEAIERLLLDPQRARAMGEAGRSAVTREYSHDRMAENMARVMAKTMEPTNPETRQR